MLSCSTLLFSSKFRILILIEKLKENNDNKSNGYIQFWVEVCRSRIDIAQNH